jgi:hypothetical protein
LPTQAGGAVAETLDATRPIPLTTTEWRRASTLRPVAKAVKRATKAVDHLAGRELGLRREGALLFITLDGAWGIHWIGDPADVVACRWQ